MINQDAFQLIEVRKEEGVTAEYLAKRLGISQGSASSWLSKWAKRGFLKLVRYSGSPSSQLEELEHLERVGTLGSEQEERLKYLRAWRYRVHTAERGKAGRPSQGKYVLGDREWASYAHGKLEERMAIRDAVKTW